LMKEKIFRFFCLPLGVLLAADAAAAGAAALDEGRATAGLMRDSGRTTESLSLTNLSERVAKNMSSISDFISRTCCAVPCSDPTGNLATAKDVM